MDSAKATRLLMILLVGQEFALKLQQALTLTLIVLPIKLDAERREKDALQILGIVQNTLEHHQLVKDILELMDIVRELIKKLMDHACLRFARKLLLASKLMRPVLNTKPVALLMVQDAQIHLNLLE